MTSKSSFFDFLRDNFIRRMWTLALSVLVFFFHFPISSLLISDAGLKYVDPANAYELARAKRYIYNDFIGLHNNQLILFLLVLLSVIVAFSAFSYLEDAKKTDFYHSLPISRNKLFYVNVINSLIIVAVPYFFMSLLSAIIIQSKTGYTDCIGIALTAFLQNYGFYAFLFMTAVLAIMLTGTKPVGVLAVLTLYFWGPIFVSLVFSYMSTYYHSYYYLPDVLSNIVQASSPVFWALGLGTDTPVVFRSVMAYVLGIVLMLLNLSLYLIRKSECAGYSIAFPVIKLPAKVLVTITCALSAGLIFNSIMSSAFWSVFAIICGTIIVHCIIEIIYNQDFKALLNHKPELLGCLIASLAVFAFFNYDLAGYDSYMPDASEVKSAGLYSGSVEDCFTESESVELIENDDYLSINYTSSDKTVVDRMQLTDIGTVQTIAMQGIEDTGTDPYENNYEKTYGGTLLIAWHLNNGKTVYRQYYMNLATVHDDLDRIIDSYEFKKGTYPILAEAEDKGNDIKGISYDDALGYHRISFNSAKGAAIAEDIKALYDAYRRDLSELTAADRRSSMPVMTIQFRDERMQEIADKLRSFNSLYSDQLNYVLYYPVYPSFERTLKLLKDYGVTVNDDINADDINTIVISDNKAYETTEDGKRIVPKADLIINDKEQIKEILASSHYSLNLSNALFPQFTDIDINAHLIKWHYSIDTAEHLRDCSAAPESVGGEENTVEYIGDTDIYANTDMYDATYDDTVYGDAMYSGRGVRSLYIFFRADEAPDFLKDYFEISDDSIERCLMQTW